MAPRNRCMPTERRDGNRASDEGDPLYGSRCVRGEMDRVLQGSLSTGWAVNHHGLGSFEQKATKRNVAMGPRNTDARNHASPLRFFPLGEASVQESQRSPAGVELGIAG